jgi:hypothetical protein
MMPLIFPDFLNAMKASAPLHTRTGAIKEKRVSLFEKEIGSCHVQGCEEK